MASSPRLTTLVTLSSFLSAVFASPCQPAGPASASSSTASAAWAWPSESSSTSTSTTTSTSPWHSASTSASKPFGSWGSSSLSASSSTWGSSGSASSTLTSVSTSAYTSTSTSASTTTTTTCSPPAAVTTTTCNGQAYVYESFAGYGFLPSDARDKFGDTIGGIGSSATIDRTSWKKVGDSYTGILWGLPDRGWNTEATINYQNRVHKFQVTLTPNDCATASNPSPPNVQLKYLDTVLFVDPSNMPTTGLDADPDPPYLTFPGYPDLPSVTYPGDGFNHTGPGGTRVTIDSEGIVLNADGSFWVSDEYGPYIYRFSAAGTMLSAIRPPDAFIPLRNNTESFSADSPPIYDESEVITPADNPTGRDNNQGFEGLTASPDGTKLYTLIQSALNQEGGLGKSNQRENARFLVYDVSDPTNPVYEAEYVVPLPFYTDPTSNKTKVAAQSEIHYVSATQFLILARDSSAGHGQASSTSVYRHADVFDISAATDVKGASDDCFTCAIASAAGVLNAGIVPATYCPFLDYNINSQLNKFGVHNGGAQDAQLLNEKWESLALVPVNPGGGDDDDEGDDDEYYLFSLSDNDFITQDGFYGFGQFSYADASGFNLDNQVLVFKVKLPKGAEPRIG